MEETIVAISTATGSGGIGIIRMSGKDCFKILEKIFKPKNKNSNISGYTIKYGEIVDSEKNEIIDEVLVSYFIEPKSYTTENMCEINSHGGMIIEKKILDLCIKNGARIANPGEFTKRAFLNGRIDLSQAEAVIDLINSKSEKEAKESLSQLEGFLSKKINNIEEKIMQTLIAIEVTVDYPEYDIEEISQRNTEKELLEIIELLDRLEKSFEQGKLLREGIKTVIVGKPNAGKSSLLNTILKEERAIVSDIEGTTRDTIEEYININGLSLKLIDTAGIRNTENEIEKIGVEKSKKLIKEADLIIAIFDITSEISEEDIKIINLIKDKNAIVVLNKTDIKKENKKMEEEIKKIQKPQIKISAKKEEGIDKLYSEIEKMFKMDKIDSNDNVLITNERHKAQIIKCKENIKKAEEAIRLGIPSDVVSVYIKQALEDLGEITGKNVTEDVINEIFKNFCLGK